VEYQHRRDAEATPLAVGEAAAVVLGKLQR
jgi:prolyl-tRNA synthetase